MDSRRARRVFGSESGFGDWELRIIQSGLKWSTLREPALPEPDELSAEIPPAPGAQQDKAA
jgi:hypothetical protein